MKNDKMAQNESILKKLTCALVFLTAILVVLTGVLLVATMYYAGESQKYAAESQSYANESTKQLQNITKLNEEMTNWYKNPEPILTNWTNRGDYSSLFLSNYKSWRNIFGPYPVFPLSQEATEITIYLWNSGRAPARFLTINLDFEIKGYENQNPTYPYPVKIYSITTSNDYLGYVGLLNGIYVNATMQGGATFVNSTGSKIEFLPEIENSTNTIDYPKDIQLGNIKPNDISSFSIKLFAMYGGIEGSMIIHIIDLNNKELQKISVPFYSI
jgi:hypothetical protein